MTPKPPLSISINRCQLRNPPPPEKGGWRETQLSPESEDGFTFTAKSSLGSQHSYGMNTEILPEDLDDLDVALLHPPEYQTDNEDDIDGDESPSPQSKCSYSMDSTHLPEGLDDFGLTAVPFHGVQDALLLPGASEFELADFPWATEPGEQFSLAAQEEDIGMDVPLRTDVDESAGSPSAASRLMNRLVPLQQKVASVMFTNCNDSNFVDAVWKWGECPLYPYGLEMQECQAGTSIQSHQDTHENATELHSKTLTICPARVQDDGFTLIFTTSLMLHDEMRRLHGIDNEIRQHYDNGLNLIAVVNGMVKVIGSGRGNISDQSTLAALKINNTFPIR
ncbi:hypothetical protein EI94DRAFT_1706617 [Lactarius quietus]|nr:hypothetical protein EI94DRAFT_1706617 [Lactarius quietus]